MNFMRVAPIPIHIFQVELFPFLKHLLPPLLSTSDPGRRLAAGLDDLLDRRDDLGAVQPDVRQVAVA